MFEQIQDWEADRLGKITASEIWKIMEKGRGGEYFGKGAKTYIRQKVAEILTLEPVNGGRANTYAMEWGNSNEKEAIDRFKKESPSADVIYYGGANPKFFEYTHFSGGSPDGVTDDGEVLEVKCPYNSGEHIEHLLLNSEEDLKYYAPEYYWQITANMIFTGLEKAVFISYDPRFAEDHLQVKILRFNINPEHKELLLERLSEAEKQLAVLTELVRGELVKE
jgi:hypothetical protein